MTIEAAATRKRLQVPDILNIVGALVLLGIIVPLALRSIRDDLPPVAEFAPEAQQQIKQAPKEQSGLFGTGQGGAGGGLLESPSPVASLVAQAAATPPLIAENEVRHCFGDPPRQTLDPQSPPCVNYWHGNNGGATSQGVTATDIYVNTTKDYSQTLERYLNHNFEFYGRTLHLIGVPNSSDGNGDGFSDKAIQQRDADAIQGGLNNSPPPFAVVQYQEVAGESYYFYDQLARHHIVSIENALTDSPLSDEAHLTAFQPYEWNYFPAPDDILNNYGEFVCKSLAGKAAAYAGPDQQPPVGPNVRRFGVVFPNYVDGAPSVDISPFQAWASSCPTRFTVDKVGFPYDPTKPSNTSSSDYTRVIQALQAAGDTSVLYLGPPQPLSLNLMPVASSQHYHPEWLVSHFTHTDNDSVPQLFPTDQANRVIALRSLNKSQPTAEQPWFWAAKTEDPNSSSTSNATGNDSVNYYNLYWDLLVLASGIQQAGPHLTPQTFQQGLYQTLFPNPGADAAPYYQARVGFAPGKHTMVSTYAPVWYSPTGPTVESTIGSAAWCYIRSGARYSSGTWPTGDFPFFQGSCR